MGSPCAEKVHSFSRPSYIAMSDIFISYASSDRTAAKRIAGVLREHGWSAWWDRSIPPGRQFDEVIEEALDAAKCVLVLWSPSSVKSSWVKTEAAEAMRRQILVPVLIESTQIPLEFRRLQAADLSGLQNDLSEPSADTQQQLEALLQALRGLLSSDQAAGAERPHTLARNAANPPARYNPQNGASARASLASIPEPACLEHPASRHESDATMAAPETSDARVVASPNDASSVTATGMRAQPSQQVALACLLSIVALIVLVVLVKNYAVSSSPTTAALPVNATAPSPTRPAQAGVGISNTGNLEVKGDVSINASPASTPNQTR